VLSHSHKAYKARSKQRSIQCFHLLPTIFFSPGLFFTIWQYFIFYYNISIRRKMSFKLILFTFKMESPMKKIKLSLRLITFTLSILTLNLCHAALTLPPEDITTSKGITYTIKLARHDKEISPAIKLLQRQFGESTVMHRAHDQEICIYTTGNQLVGVLKIESPVKHHPSIFITHFTVDKNHRNKGIGSALLTYLIKHAAGPIELSSENKAAARLYRKFGFISYDPKDPQKMRKS
jgi:ribosomal protein S18 acetylase RimI-like enzyme